MKTTSLRYFSLIVFAFGPSACGLFPQHVAPPPSIVSAPLQDSKATGNKPTKKKKLRLITQSESDFVKTWNLCEPNSDDEVGAHCDQQKLLNEGMAVIDDRCGIYFASLGKAAQDNGFGSKEWNLVGGVTGAIEGLTGISAKAIAITSSGFGLGSSSSAAFADAYIFSADVASVQTLVATAQASARESINAVIKQQPNPNKSMTRDDVAKILKQYEKTCEVQTIRGLINQSLQKAKIETNAPPQITSEPRAKFTAGQLGSFTVAATGYPEPSFTKGECPTWVQLDKTKGTLSGTPAATDAGTNPCVISAQNGIKPDASQGVAITVDNPGGAAAPGKISSPSSARAIVDAPFSFHIETSFTAATTITAVGCPGWLVFDNVNTLSGTPHAADMGSSSCKITATAGASTVSQSLTLTVVKAAPVNVQLNFNVE